MLLQFLKLSIEALRVAAYTHMTHQLSQHRRTHQRQKVIFKIKHNHYARS